MLAAKDAWQELLHAVQRELMVVMSHVATPSGVVNPNPLSAAELTLRCEQEMDAMTVLLTDNGYFLLPGGTPISANCSLPVPWPAVPNAVCGHSIAKTP